MSADHVVTVNPLTFRNLAGPRAGVCVCVRWGCMLFPEPAKSIRAYPANHVISCGEPAYVSKLGWRPHSVRWGCMLFPEPAKSIRALRLLTTQPRSRTRVLVYVPERTLRVVCFGAIIYIYIYLFLFIYIHGRPPNNKYHTCLLDWGVGGCKLSCFTAQGLYSLHHCTPAGWRGMTRTGFPKDCGQQPRTNLLRARRWHTSPFGWVTPYLHKGSHVYPGVR